MQLRQFFISNYYYYYIFEGPILNSSKKEYFKKFEDEISH